jgi:hypothetical protein
LTGGAESFTKFGHNNMTLHPIFAAGGARLILAVIDCMLVVVHSAKSGAVAIHGEPLCDLSPAEFKSQSNS